ncbi:MAG TPA: type II toxin-antitoxin system Phd/YefM family antitoxin [Allosphingosinicella sp.]|uniref:type II toxin-antitoxin system Phd/YefM family antitoxin n=1 Tax=Allosphingosinicella sp. TaxID=2823234 RepID=UPI002F293DBC
MGRMIGAAEFKAKCLRILDEVERTGEPVTITKRGRAVGELRPAGQQERKGAKFGFLKHPYYLGVDDLTMPAYDGPWDAELGILD